MSGLKTTINGTWVHVDPSDKVWNNPSRYQSWDWGSAIGSDVKIYAFEDGTFQDVTSNLQCTFELGPRTLMLNPGFS